MAEGEPATPPLQQEGASNTALAASSVMHFPPPSQVLFKLVSGCWLQPCTPAPATIGSNIWDLEQLGTGIHLGMSVLSKASAMC
jgi:hypothetical protein